ncbi:T9SS type A sorting domain-containing protein [Kaistella faecalis]|uniref:glycine-rich domain-containing protein n=1 Tax=Kaistella faecalis TaxID=2852098 RepID=UPI001C46F690|nr:T9SS type A sorting domain-containing protein [Chryseobacterium faecale]
MSKKNTLFHSGIFLNILPLLAIIMSSFSFGQATQTYNAPGTYTFKVPPGVTSLKIEAWGAGSGGNNDISRGGGGGAFAGNNTVAVTPGAEYTVRVGGGGAAGTGNNGEDSSFGSLVVAKGGNGAAGGSASASTGTITYSGGNGGRSYGNGGAGGGGSAGALGDGGNGADTNSGTGAAGGAAGSGGGAAGGNGGNTNNNGGNGAFPGGGGGERGSNGTSIGSGAGGNGQVIITYTPAYVAQIISANTGSATWCAGETRNVSVTIKNVGSQPWTDIPGTGGKDFNIGIKWNQNGTSWPDYNVRVDAGNLAPGDTKTYTFTITASNNVGGAYTTPLAAGMNNLTFDVVYEAVAWFGNNPAGTGVGPGNAVFTTPAQTITALTSVGNNILSYTNGTSGRSNATAAENGNAGLTAPAGTYFATVNFASYGMPGGTAPNFTFGSCHAATSQSVTENYLLGNSGSVTIPATNAVFGDPCSGTVKKLSVSASYVQPVCSGSSVTITGTTPTGGNGTFTYLWESSTTSATSGFVPASGTNNGLNYTTGALAQTTWFRRYVTSGCASGYSAVVMVKVNPTPAVPVIATAAPTCAAQGTATITNYAATNAYTFNPAGPTVGSGGVISGLTAGTSYTVTSGNASCTSSASASFSVAARLPNGTVTLSSAAGTNSQIRCINSAITAITYTTTGATGATVTGLPAGVTGSWASNVLTISGTPTASGTFNYTVTLTGGCGSSTATGTITVTAANTVGTASSTPTLCISTPLTAITHSTTGATGIGTATGLPAGVSASWSGNVITISGTPTASGTFNYSIPLTGGCGSINATGTITVTANNTVTLTSAAGTNSQTRCINSEVTPITYATTGATGATVTGLPAGLTGAWASNVVTISGTPTQAGTFNYTVTLTGGCGQVTATGTIMVTVPSVGGTVASAQTICSGNAPADLILSGHTGSVVKWQKSADAAFTGSVDIAYTSTTLTGALIGNLTANTYFRAVVQNGSCSVAYSAPVLITVNPLPTAAVSAIGTGQICTTADVVFNIVGTPGSLVSYNLNGAGTTNITLSAGGTAQVTVNGATSSQTLNLISASNGTCTGMLTGSSSTATVIFSATTWNGTSWDNGLPDNTKMAIFAADYFTALGDITACACQTNSGVTLTIAENDFVEVQKNIINNGNIVVKSNGNLIQKSDSGTYIAGTGASFTVERSVENVRNDLATFMDYVYWSSPVTGQDLQAFSPGTPRNRIFQYNESNDYFYQAPESEFINGKGYAFRAEGGLSNPYSKTYTFKGVPNNGVITRAVTKSPNTGVGGAVEHGYNLIGNPYPSNINVDQLFINNASVIHGTAWFWHNKIFTLNQQGSSYSGNNYAVYNGTGGTGATGGAVAPNGIVQVGQGFLVQAKTAGTVVFRNSYGAGDDLRVSTPGIFYQKGNQKNRFWLELKSPKEIINSQLIGYVPGSTDGYEKDYDAEILGLTSDVFYSKTGDRRLLIQGKGLFTDTDKVVLGANFFENGNYTISLQNAEGVFSAGQAIYLRDLVLNTETNLATGSYTFAAGKGLSEGRFEIVYRPGAVLASGNNSKDVLEVFRDADDFTVRSSNRRIAQVEVFDASGRLAHSYAATGKQTVVPAQTLANGIYILKITLENGEQVQRKIVK